jgi:hypothetical protein
LLKKARVTQRPTEPNERLPHCEYERQATLIKLKSPALPLAGFFSAKRILVMDEGFPPHIVGFMRRKREKEQDKERGEKPSQS